MKTKLLTIAMTAALMLTAMTKVQAQNFEGPCLPYAHGLKDHQSAFCGSAETQTVQLIAGVNWFSTYLEIERTDLEAALLAVLPTATNIVIQSQGGTDRYNGTRWRTTGGFTWNVTQMYMINVPEDCEITLTGMPINPEEKPITITANAANWIGFPFSESVGYEVALGTDFQPANGDVIQSPTSSLRYVSTRWRATNGFTNFEPGKGYIFNSKATYDRTLIFQNGSKSVQRARKELPFGNIQPITKTMFKLSKTGKVSSNELATKRKRQ